MKLYSSSPKASTSMLFDDILIKEISNIKDKITIIIESGTYLGNGSTKMLSDIFSDSKTIKKLITIEANSNFYFIALENLKDIVFVECINGFSLDLSECINFIDNDEYLLNHEKYDDIYIDSFDPISNYKNEIMVSQGKPQNLLKKLISENIDEELLIVLDSAGGIGYFEYLSVKEILKNKNYYLLMDDVDHIKHYRSKKDIMNNDSFDVIITNDNYLLCKHHKRFL